MIFDLAARDPDGLAVDDLLRQRSWAELAERSVRAARYMRGEAGLVPGDHVAVLMENRVEYVELILGAIMAGVWITPINWHLAREEIAYVIEDSGAKLLVSDPGHEEIARGLPIDGQQILLAGAELDAALARAASEPMPGDGPAGGNMIYTSGTSGRPKGVKRARPVSVSAALEQLGRLGTNIGLDGSGPHLITGPMYHAAPLMFAVYDNANGAPIVIMPRWDEAQALALMAEREIAHTHLVPTMFVRLLRLPESLRAAFRAPKLSLVLHGAAPVAVTVKRRMIEWWGEVLVEYWGATEGGVNTLVDSADWLAHPGTVGRALPAFEIFARDEAGERLPPGEAGDLYCRHGSLDRVFEYHGDAEKTAVAHPEPGVFTIGDIGYVDEEGYVYLADRRSSTIISGGVNIYPAEIEQVLHEHPAVHDAAVFGIPDEEWGESVKAAVEIAPGFQASPALEAEMLDFAREHLARYKVPRSIDFEDELPRHPTGKLYTRLLRDRYWKDRDRSI
ncbi:MAG: AMP-binding protein [Deltaproteobacteria bacterium]|nr:AMP-binding protein [Deltaproteobacteria bacterium]MBW2421750.1 AMP-binding protein [Deltaproteobacteria bacterium]